MSFKRARRDEQKESRINEICAVALEQFDRNGYDKVSISTIAKDLSFVRSNIYKYFSSKEEIFLQILGNTFDDIHTEIMAAYSGQDAISNREFAIKWCSIITNHITFLKLMPLLSTIIEKNVSLDRLVAFKVDFLHKYAGVIEFIHTIRPDLSVQDIEFFMLKQYLYSSSLFQMTIHTDIQQEALRICREEHNLDFTPPDFNQDFFEFSLFILNGLTK